LHHHNDFHHHNNFCNRMYMSDPHCLTKT